MIYDILRVSAGTKMVEGHGSAKAGQVDHISPGTITIYIHS
jgi:hypothetical protein